MEPECKQESCAESAGPHHGRPNDGGELGIARGAEGRGNDHVGGLERLQNDIAPQAEFAETNDFRVVRVEREKFSAENRDDDGDDESAGAPCDKALVKPAVRLVEIMGAYEVGYQDLVPAAQTDAQNDGEHGKVRTENAGVMAIMPKCTTMAVSTTWKI